MRGCSTLDGIPCTRPPCGHCLLALPRPCSWQGDGKPKAKPRRVKIPPAWLRGAAAFAACPSPRDSCCGRGGSSSRRLDFCPLSHFPQIPGEGPGSFSPCPAGKNRCVPCATSTSPVPPASNLQEPPASTCPVLPAFPVGDPPVFEPCWGAGANHPWETTTKSPNSFKAKPNLPLSPPKKHLQQKQGQQAGVTKCFKASTGTPKSTDLTKTPDSSWRIMKPSLSMWI